jgi:hypothetical protein
MNCILILTNIYLLYRMNKKTHRVNYKKKTRNHRKIGGGWFSSPPIIDPNHSPWKICKRGKFKDIRAIRKIESWGTYFQIGNVEDRNNTKIVTQIRNITSSDSQYDKISTLYKNTICPLTAAQAASEAKRQRLLAYQEPPALAEETPAGAAESPAGAAAPALAEETPAGAAETPAGAAETPAGAARAAESPAGAAAAPARAAAAPARAAAPAARAAPAPAARAAPARAPAGAAEETTIAQPESLLDPEVDERVVDNMLRSSQQNICIDTSNNVNFYFILIVDLQSIQRKIEKPICSSTEVCMINTINISDDVKKTMFNIFSNYISHFPNPMRIFVNRILSTIKDTLDFKVLSGILEKQKLTNEDLYNYIQEILSNPVILNRIGDAINPNISIMDFSNIIYNEEPNIIYIFNFDPLIDFISKLVLKNKKKLDKLIFKYVNISYHQLTQLKKITNSLEYSFFYTSTELHKDMHEIDDVVVCHYTWKSPPTGGNRTRKKRKNRRTKYKGGGWFNWFNKPTSMIFNDKWKKIGDSDPQKAILEQTAWDGSKYLITGDVENINTDNEYVIDLDDVKYTDSRYDELYKQLVCNEPDEPAFHNTIS